MGTGQGSRERVLVVSSDGHAGPHLEEDLRPYCPDRRLDEFDAFARRVREGQRAVREESSDRNPLLKDRKMPGTVMGTHLSESLPEATRAAMRRSRTAGGLRDPRARLADMDAQGIAAEVVFAGGQNGEPLPFVGYGINVGSPEVARELWTEGGRIWNRWLADYVSVAPDRLIGVMQVPIWDLDGAVEEIRRSHAAGLRAVNFPAPRSDIVAYNDPCYEPLWEVCVELDLPLLTHTGGGDPPLGMGNDGLGAFQLMRTEILWLSRRGLWQLIFGEVFDRHPELRLVFAEQRVGWVPETLRSLDAIASCDDEFQSGVRKSAPTKLPSEWWATNCFLGASFPAPFEIALRREVGIGNLMWGSDYPHVEGTWPRTDRALRYAFAGVEEGEARMILGENAVRAFGLDEAALREVAARIGPTMADIDRPLAPEEVPEFRGQAFRQVGDYS